MFSCQSQKALKKIVSSNSRVIRKNRLDYWHKILLIINLETYTSMTNILHKTNQTHPTTQVLFP